MKVIERIFTKPKADETMDNGPKGQDSTGTPANQFAYEKYLQELVPADWMPPELKAEIDAHNRQAREALEQGHQAERQKQVNTFLRSARKTHTDDGLALRASRYVDALRAVLPCAENYLRISPKVEALCKDRESMLRKRESVLAGNHKTRLEREGYTDPHAVHLAAWSHSEVLEVSKQIQEVERVRFATARFVRSQLRELVEAITAREVVFE